MDSGATNNYLDPALTPGVRAHMCDVEDLQVPHTIVTAGQRLLEGVTTGTIFGAVTDDNGNDRRVSFRVYREGGVSRRRPQGRHIRLHEIRVSCGNNATECSTDNQGSAATPEAAQWNAAAEREIASLEYCQV